MDFTLTGDAFVIPSDMIHLLGINNFRYWIINMNKITKKISLTTILCLSAFAISNAHAAMVNFTLSGQITTVGASNPFGLTLDANTITATGTFDDTSFIATSSTSSILDFTTSYNNMQINIGSLTFNDAADVYGGALLYFTNNAFGGLNFRSENINNIFISTGNPDLQVFGGTTALTSDGLPLIIDNFSQVTTSSYITGTWDSASFTTSPVPVPAAAWLFGSGLIFLAGFNRKRKKS